MKVKILGVVILAALILAVAFSASAPAAPNTASANAVPAPAPAPEPAKAVPADHPEIHDAINSLRHAREHLDHAAHDFGWIVRGRSRGEVRLAYRNQTVARNL